MALRSGLSTELAKHVLAAVQGVTIRSGVAEDVVYFSTALSAELEFVAQAYTGCVNTKEIVWDESMDFVVSRFGMLNLHEIRHAFRLAASGEIEVNLKAYYGTFTVGMLGDLLTAYLSRRQELCHVARQIENKELYLESGNLRTHDVEAWKDNRIKYLLLLDSPKIETVTAYDYIFLVERGEIDLDRDGKWAVFDRALQFVIRDMTDESGRSNHFVSKSLNHEISLAKSGNPSEAFLIRQQSMAKRLSVLDWINSKRQ